MKRIIVFGKNCEVVEQKSDKDLVEYKNNKLIIGSCKMPSNSLLNDFLANLLHSQLLKIYDKIRREGKIEVLSGLDFEIVERIDNRKQRVAKLKGNKILIKLNAVALPKNVLKYVISHEIAHSFTKRHTKKFWKTLELICPDFKKNQELLAKYSNFITGKLLRED